MSSHPVKTAYDNYQKFVFSYRGRPYVFTWSKGYPPAVSAYGAPWEETTAKKLQHAKTLWWRNGDPYMARHAADFFKEVISVKCVVWLERH